MSTALRGGKREHLPEAFAWDAHSVAEAKWGRGGIRVAQTQSYSAEHKCMLLKMVEVDSQVAIVAWTRRERKKTFLGGRWLLSGTRPTSTVRSRSSDHYSPTDMLTFTRSKRQLLMLLTSIIALLHTVTPHRQFMAFVPNGDKVPCDVAELTPAEQLQACSGTGICEVFGHERCEASGRITEFGRLAGAGVWSRDRESPALTRVYWPHESFCVCSVCS